MPHKQGHKDIKTNKPIGSKNTNDKKQIGSKEGFVLIDKKKLYEDMYGKPIEKGSKEHKDMVRGLYELMMYQGGNVMPDKLPDKYVDEDFSIPDGTNPSFFT